MFGCPCHRAAQVLVQVWKDGHAYGNLSQSVKPVVSHAQPEPLLISRIVRTESLADPGGAADVRAPPKGPDSFVLTYKFFET